MSEIALTLTILVVLFATAILFLWPLLNWLSVRLLKKRRVRLELLARTVFPESTFEVVAYQRKDRGGILGYRLDLMLDGVEFFISEVSRRRFREARLDFFISCKPIIEIRIYRKTLAPLSEIGLVKLKDSEIDGVLAVYSDDPSAAQEMIESKPWREFLGVCARDLKLHDAFFRPTEKRGLEPGFYCRRKGTIAIAVEEESEKLMIHDISEAMLQIVADLPKSTLV